ncbi:MAG: CRISPR-associated endonuclease Cas2 [Thermodesulfobacterium geofontis]|uniref:CRISPR-associated endonuclease Cas2 n=1 Tax=Thermodesulfobacterium geofontis TaxID=1295609 RepID=A0A2N7QEU7_9BACT|nr:MAG: CRISPR-associated endonuclease Cas2 [Thermodesulfobacterium geofontis]
MLKEKFVRIILYDYETEKVRAKVRKNLKKLGIHAQWSVFESLESYENILKVLLEEEGENFRTAVFRLNPKGEIKKIGKEWEKIKYVF